MYFKAVLGFVFRSQAKSIRIDFLYFIFIFEGLQVPGPGAMLVDHNEGNFNFAPIVLFLMFSPSLCKL